MPISVMALIRFFFIDIVKYLLLVTLFWSCRPLWTGIFVKLFYELLADDSAHLTDGLHTANQVLLHSHNQIPPKIKVVVGRGLRTVDCPRIIQIVFAILLADNSTHLADGLHTADQVLHSHIITSKTVMVDQEYIQFRNLR